MKTRALEAAPVALAFGLLASPASAQAPSTGASSASAPAAGPWRRAPGDADEARALRIVRLEAHLRAAKQGGNERTAAILEEKLEALREVEARAAERALGRRRSPALAALGIVLLAGGGLALLGSAAHARSGRPDDEAEAVTIAITGGLVALVGIPVALYGGGRVRPGASLAGAGEVVLRLRPGGGSVAGTF